jgi:hypothetical protein
MCNQIFEHLKIAAKNHIKIYLFGIAGTNAIIEGNLGPRRPGFTPKV